MTPTCGPARKRDQVLVACERCRSKKTKCDGTRPVCSPCYRRGATCVWQADRAPDATPITAAKRKLEQLQPQLVRHEQFIDILRNGSEAEAHRLYPAIRSGSDLESALQAVRYQHWPAERITRHDHLFTHRHVLRRRSSNDVDQHRSRVQPSKTRDRVLQRGAFAQENLSRRRSASVPTPSVPRNLNRQGPPPLDRRLQLSRARHWGAAYLDDITFRSILQSWFTWDHPGFLFFDEDIFLDQLATGRHDELCCPLSINAMIALASKNYHHFEPEKAAMAEHFSLVEASKLWEMSQGESEPTTIVAGLTMFLCYGLKGQDKVGSPYLFQAEHVAKIMGLFRPALSAKVYNQEDQYYQRTKSRQAVAYGIFNFRAYLSIINNIPPLSERPAVPLPEAAAPDDGTLWAPWKWRIPDQPKLKDKLFRARCTLSLIVAEVLPLHRKYEHQKPSKEQHDRALEIYRHLQNWYTSLDSSLRDLHNSSPQLIGLHNYYQLANFELLSPFVLSPDGPSSFLPTTQRLREATLPEEPAMSGYIDVLRQMRTNILHFDRQYSPQAPTPPQNFAPIVHLCMAALPCLDYDRESRYIFALGLILCSRIAKSFYIYRHILRSIQKFAQKKEVTLPPLADRIFARLDQELPVLPGLDKVRSTFVVDVRLRHTDVEKSTLESLVAQMGGMGMSSRMDTS